MSRTRWAVAGTLAICAGLALTATQAGDKTNPPSLPDQLNALALRVSALEAELATTQAALSDEVNRGDELEVDVEKIEEVLGVITFQLADAIDRIEKLEAQ